MTTVTVLFATREGQTQKIAEFVAASFRRRGLDAVLRNVTESAALDLRRCAAVVLAASVHAGKHEPEMVRFVRNNIAVLDAIPSAFLSVCLSEAGVERSANEPAARARFEADVRKLIADFERETGWRARRVKAVAGALLYSHYNFALRYIMKRIARSAGGDADTSRDYEYTNWKELDRFVDEFSKEIVGAGATARNMLEGVL